MHRSKLRSKPHKITINTKTGTRDGIWCRPYGICNWPRTTRISIGWGTVSTLLLKHSPTACWLGSRSIMKWIITNSPKPSTAYIKSAKSTYLWPNRSSLCRISATLSTPRIWPTTSTKTVFWRSSSKKSTGRIPNHSTKFYCQSRN